MQDGLGREYQSGGPHALAAVFERTGCFGRELDSSLRRSGPRRQPRPIRATTSIRTGWLHDLESVSQTLNIAWSELAVMERLFPSLPGIGQYRATLQNITRTSNTFLFQVVEQLADAYSGGIPHGWSAE